MSTATPIEHWGVRKAARYEPVFKNNELLVRPGLDSPTLVGIEVEVENATDIGKLNKVWAAKTDGSLRNNGMEFVTHPIEAKMAPSALNSLMRGTLKESCCFSPRTSIHVHVDMSEIPIEKAINLALVYGCFEPLFYRFVSRNRANNIYCVPITKTGLVMGLVRVGASDKIRRWSKYTGLNLITLMTLGTVEFRHMHGTFDTGKVSDWIKLIVKLRDWIVNQETDKIRSMVLSMDEFFDYPKLLNEIFGYEDSLLIKYREYNDIAESVDAIKQGWTNMQVVVEKYSSDFQVDNSAPYFQFKAR